MRIDWLRPLVYLHRWMGIVGGLLILMWFASGIVMMYHGMPEVGAVERLERLEPIDPIAIAVAPLEAAAAVGGGARAFRLNTLLGRPVYRFGTRAVFADTGELIEGVSADEAMTIVGGAGTYDALITAPDQWTLQSRAYLPLHRIALGDPEDTRVYVSQPTGEVVMRTTRSGRAWAYGGAVLHWLYFTPFRVHSALWAQTIIWLSVAGCVLSLSGILWGLLRFSPVRIHRPGGSRPARSPYSGLLKWHHYAGLVFGLFTFTWMLSGGLSMDPWSWHPGTGPTQEQREGVSGGPLELGGLSARLVSAAAASLASGGVLKEVEIVRFGGAPYFVGRGNDPSRQLLVSALDPAGGFFDRFSSADVIDAAVAAMPGVGIREMTWLEEYDAYYYARNGEAPLPVLRVLYADAQNTALYLDPSRGVIARKEERLTRLNRWLYHGFHSLDFPFLYRSRPLWDIVMILLSLGGVAVAATTLWPGWQRLVRQARRLAGR
jgi:hypothetical protein